MDTSRDRRYTGIAYLISSFIMVVAVATPMSTAMERQQSKNAAVATFAGGCFWCMEGPFEQLDGVYAVTSGYTGGTTVNPTYEDVSSGKTGHAEAVQITYDPAKVTYEQLLDVFWRQIDPTTPDQQFADQGTQYRTAIFYHTDAQQRAALASKEQLEHSGKFDKPVVTKIVAAGPFYPAEEYHQNYYKKNATHYQLYRAGSGREGFLRKLWGGQGKTH